MYFNGFSNLLRVAAAAERREVLTILVPKAIATKRPQGSFAGCWNPKPC